MIFNRTKRFVAMTFAKESPFLEPFMRTINKMTPRKNFAVLKSRKLFLQKSPNCVLSRVATKKRYTNLTTNWLKSLKKLPTHH